MSTPLENDPALARFRRGASAPAGPPGPPPVVPESARARWGESAIDPAEPMPGSIFVPPSEGPITMDSLPSTRQAMLPGAPRPLFGEVIGTTKNDNDARGSGASAPLFDSPIFDSPTAGWARAGTDPGKVSGVVAIVVGAFIGIVGVFIAIFSIRRSREVGLAGVFGFVGLLVSMASLVVVACVGVSYLRYEAQLARQCSLVGPGQFLTQSGDQVTCP